MGININDIKLTGVITFEPEEHFTTDGKSICNFSMAFDKDQFVRVSCYDKTAQFASHNLKKGSKIFVEGKLFYQAWQDKSGNKRNLLSIRAYKVQTFNYTKANAKPNDFSYESNSESEEAPF